MIFDFFYFYIFFCIYKDLNTAAIHVVSVLRKEINCSNIHLVLDHGCFHSIAYFSLIKTCPLDDITCLLVPFV